MSDEKVELEDMKFDEPEKCGFYALDMDFFKGVRFKVVDQATRQDIEFFEGEDWVEKTHSLTEKPDRVIVYHECTDNGKTEPHWHMFTLYFDGEEFVHSKVVNTILDIKPLVELARDIKKIQNEKKQ